MTRHYDVILNNGRLLLRVPQENLPQLDIAKSRRLGPTAKLPWFGLVLRYMWAKKHGALLENPSVFDPATDL